MRLGVGLGVAVALCIAPPALAQWHGAQQSAAPPHPVGSAAPAPPHTRARGASRGIYRDCLRRYGDRQGCRYLAWSHAHRTW